jgi:hypothetical protein
MTADAADSHLDNYITKIGESICFIEHALECIAMVIHRNATCISRFIRCISKRSFCELREFILWQWQVSAGSDIQPPECRQIANCGERIPCARIDGTLSMA